MKIKMEFERTGMSREVLTDFIDRMGKCVNINGELSKVISVLVTEENVIVNLERHTEPIKRFENVILQTKEDTEQVLNDFVGLIKEYGHASVSDLFDLVGIISSFKDHKYGWTKSNDINVLRCKAGYIISLPEPIELK